MIDTQGIIFRSALRWLLFGGLALGNVSLDSTASAGEMYRWVDEQGHIHLTDTRPKPNRQDVKIYQSRDSSQPLEGVNTAPAGAGSAKLTQTKPGGVVTVDAVLNRRLTVPLMLDTGADFTVITKQVAQELRIHSLERLPKLELNTAGGLVSFPVTTLQSLRVGTAEARDVTVAIDTGGHMPIGLLGMSFLRHFKVTVDHQRGQVTFER